MVWSTQWPEPFDDEEGRDNWRVYVLIAEGCDFTPWEFWVHQWLKRYALHQLPEICREWLRLASVLKDPACPRYFH